MKKINFLLLSLFMAMTVTITKVYAKINQLPLLGNTIYIDPGHPSYLFPNIIMRNNK